MDRVKIDDVAFGGNGVGRSDGKALFVPFTIAGEEVSVRVIKQKKNFAIAELISVDVPSPHRVQPHCPYFGECGGCAYQHIDYAKQLAIKSRQVEQTLRRVGKFAELPMEPIVASLKPYGYRNRICVHAADGVIGYYAREGHRVIDVEKCPIASAAVNEGLTDLRRHRLHDGDYTVNEPNRPRFFEQVNDDVAREMLEVVRGLVRRGQAVLIDAYAGAGFFAKGLADLFESTFGIESNPFAVEEARRSAGEQEKYVIGDVANYLPDALSSRDSTGITLVLDPPAIGIPARVSDAILASTPIEIVYVSCDPATLARDLAILCRTYRLESVTPLDMFPQTAEIEVVAHLTLPT